MAGVFVLMCISLPLHSFYFLVLSLVSLVIAVHSVTHFSVFVSLQDRYTHQMVAEVVGCFSALTALSILESELAVHS